MAIRSRNRDAIKALIDELPPGDFERLVRFVESIKNKPARKRKLQTMNLGGQFDKVNLRKLVYE